MEIPPGVDPPSPKQVRVKVEFTDCAGAKYTLSIEGNSREGLNKIMDLVDSLTPHHSTQTSSTPQPDQIDTNFSRVYTLLQKNFTFGSFTSKDVLDAWQAQTDHPTSLSVISTYLTRLARRKLLTRTRQGSAWIYKVPTSPHPRTSESLPTTFPQQLLSLSP
jgi:hypothetical protein